MIDLAELRRLAEAATPGPWTATRQEWDHVHDRGWNVRSNTTDKAITGWGRVTQTEQDAAYIAAFNPATALALLERLEAAEKRVAELEAAVRDAREQIPLRSSHDRQS